MHRMLKSFRYAVSGLAFLVRTQPNARIHLVVTIGVVIVGLWVRLSPLDWAVVTATIGLVLAAEAFNTALEAAVDLANPDPHPLAKAAKDVGAGAVTLTALAAVIVGLLLLGPPLWDRLSGN